MSEVGLRIKEAREARGMSQAELANSTGMAQSSIANIEAVRTNIGLAALVRVANVLGVTTDWLVGRKGPKEDYTDEELIAEFDPAHWATLSKEEQRIRLDMLRKARAAIKRLY